MKMVFEVGDVVRLVSSRPRSWSSNGRMDKFLDTIQVIRSLNGSFVSFVNPATQGFAFNTSEIARFENDHLGNDQISFLQQMHERFPEGQKFYSAMSGKKFTSKGLLYGKNEGAWFNVLDKGENYIFYKGKTAELREAKPARPTLTFNGNPVTYNKDTEQLSIGCKNIDPDDLDVLYSICKDYNITSLQVDGSSSRTVTPSDLKTWIDFINNQY